MKFLFTSVFGIALLATLSFTKPSAVVVGGMAPEIELMTPAGKALKLSSLRGKIVLIDFWASWCGPCRKENPHVVEVYNKYHGMKFKNGKSFEVFSVSLDRDEASWKKAIEADHLVWPSHVWDRTNEAGKAYNVQFIPTAFLVDGTGKIVAMGEDCHGLNLHVQLDKLKK